MNKYKAADKFRSSNFTIETKDFKNQRFININLVKFIPYLRSEYILVQNSWF